jgi:hypothetical protein
MHAAEISYPEAISACVDACQRCHQSCLEEVTRLLETEPGASTSKVFASLVACIGILRVTAEMLLQDSDVHEEAARLCAASCRTCATLCNGIEGMEACMKACIDCAQCCEHAAGRKAA